MNKAVTDLKPEAEVPLSETHTRLALLRKTFEGGQISKLPKETKAQIDARKGPNGRSVCVSCKVCGGWHHKDAVHLDYVGHAAVTDRLLSVDPEWSWEPLAFTPEGLPALDQTGGLWIKLTVCGVTRIGFGSADGKRGGDAIKELIGDAIRNAAMRFGVALDLWHKGDLHAEPEEPAPSMEERAIAHLRACAIDRNTFKDAWEKNKTPWGKAMDRDAYGRVVAEMKRLAGTLPAEAAPETPPQQPENDFGLSGDEIPY